MMCIETMYGNSCMWIGIGLATIFWLIFYVVLELIKSKEKKKKVDKWVHEIIQDEK